MNNNFIVDVSLSVLRHYALGIKHRIIVRGKHSFLAKINLLNVVDETD